MEQYFQYFVYIVLILQLILSLKKSIYGLCGLISVRILIPEIVKVSPSISLSVNTICVTFLLFGILKERKLEVLKTSISKIFFIFFIFLLLCLVLSDYEDIKYQSFSTIKLFLTDYLPAILAFCIIKSKNDIKLFVKVLAITVLLSCTWAVITMVIGFNPYSILIGLLYKEDYLDTADAFMGAASSGTFTHTNGFGFFIPIAFSIFLLIYSYDRSKIYIIVLILLLMGALCCQKRTCFIALFLYLLFLMLFSNKGRKLSIIKYGIGSLFLLGVIVSSLPKESKVSQVVAASLFFWNDKVAEKNDVGGSSMEMRIEQISYPFVMIQDNLLFGKGSGYIDYYQHVEGNLVHPVLKGFETLLSKIEVETGLIGFFLWGWFLVKLIKATNPHDKRRNGLFWGFWLSQIIVWLASGFSSFAVFGVFSVVIPKLKLLIINSSNEQSINSNSRL